MKRNQINLANMPLEKNKAFLRGLYETDYFLHVARWFDKLDGSSFARQSDKSMTLDTFLDIMTKRFYVKLKMGSPTGDKIVCSSGGRDDQNIERIFWVECLYTPYNYDVVTKLFKKVYGKDIESIPVVAALKTYHKEMGWD